MARYRIVRTKDYKCFNVLKKSRFLGIPYWKKIEYLHDGEYTFFEQEAIKCVQAAIRDDASRKKTKPWVEEWRSLPRVFREYE